MKISKFLNSLLNNQDEMLAVLDYMEKVVSSKKEWVIINVTQNANRKLNVDIKVL